MGNCLGDVSAEKKKNDMLDKQLRSQWDKENGKIKILLLGAGESGKSTLFKQMKLLYTNQASFSEEEKETFRRAIYSNIIQDSKTLALATENHTPIKDVAILDIVKEIQSWVKEKELGPNDGAMLVKFWNDPNVQATWEDRGDIQVQDALEYFMKPENISRIENKSFIPTDQDILRSRIRTSGVVIESFRFEKTIFEMHDVGGQRNERRKWIHSFDAVTTVLFVVAISEYNQVLYEDHSVSRQQESLDLFREQVNQKMFLKTPFIVFFNKDDLFREKLAKIPFKIESGPNKRNADYEGPVLDYIKEYAIDGSDEEFEDVYQHTRTYLSDLYKNTAEGEDRQSEIHPHFTNSTDSDNIGKIMETAKHIILKANLKSGGWI